MSKDLERIKDSANIVDLIAEFIPVKKSGTNYLCLCPFHNDKKPSMYISPSKGIYKCFSCGAGGDVIKFWQEYFKKDFRDAVKELAQKYGIEIENFGRQKEESENFNLKIKLHELASKYYHEQLLASFAASKARDYLQNRKLSNSSIIKYQLGYAPKDSDNLCKYLKDQIKVEDQKLIDSGLAINKQDKIIDRFRDKIIIPIYDERNRVIAFGSRIYEQNDDGPKYINSPETEIYHKGSTLFALNFAKESIRKKDYVILVEGFFDQIMLNQFNIGNAVANQGTALTASQVKLLGKYTDSKKIYLCFDNDEAGQKACQRAVEIIYDEFKAYDYQINIISLQDCKDADEFLQKYGAQAFDEAIQKASNYFDLKIQELVLPYRKSSPQDKLIAIKNICRIFGQINNEIILGEYIKQVGEILDIDHKLIYREFEKTNNNQYSPKPKEEKTFHKLNPIELEFLILTLEHKNFIEKFFQDNHELIDPRSQAILAAILEIHLEEQEESNIETKYKKLFEKLGQEDQYSQIISEIGFRIEQKRINLDTPELASSLMKRLKISKLNNLVAKIKTEMQELKEDTSEYSYKVQEKLKIESEIHKIRSS